VEALVFQDELLLERVDRPAAPGNVLAEGPRIAAPGLPRWRRFGLIESGYMVATWKPETRKATRESGLSACFFGGDGWN